MSATHIHATVRATHATPPRARSRGVRFAQPSIAALPKTSTTRCPGLSSRGALRGDDALAADIVALGVFRASQRRMWALLARNVTKHWIRSNHR